MGARTSISFKNGKEESITLFSHWGGDEFPMKAIRYAEKLMKAKKGKQFSPIDRLEPNTVMVDFIREITKNLEEVDGDLYLGKDQYDGDNSDYGHHIIKLT